MDTITLLYNIPVGKREVFQNFLQEFGGEPNLLQKGVKPFTKWEKRKAKFPKTVVLCEKRRNTKGFFGKQGVVKGHLSLIKDK